MGKNTHFIVFCNFLSLFFRDNVVLEFSNFKISGNKNGLFFVPEFHYFRACLIDVVKVFFKDIMQ